MSAFSTMLLGLKMVETYVPLLINMRIPTPPTPYYGSLFKSDSLKQHLCNIKQIQIFSKMGSA